MHKKVLGWAALGMGLLISFAAILLLATSPSEQSPSPFGSPAFWGIRELGSLLLLTVGASILIAGVIFLLKIHFER